MSTFPEDFLWGASTAAHQVEGGNVNSGMWRSEWAKNSTFAEPSGDACDHYHRYPEDIATLAGLGLNAYRFGVEWARIEPEEGYFSRAALDHYRRMVGTCLEHGVTPVVTYSHFSTPRWFADAGGWSNPAAADRFARYAGRVTEHIGDLVPWVCTFNEPNVISLMVHLGVIPAASRDETLGLSTGNEGQDPGEARSGEALSGAAWAAPSVEVMANAHRKAVEAITTQTGWEIYPQALGHTVRLAAEHAGVPVLVTENGMATDDDDARIAYTTAALEGLAGAIADGVDVRGYLHWSLLDNFEWTSGYQMTFGLIAVDRTTFTRTVKPSARWLGKVARAGGLT